VFGGLECSLPNVRIRVGLGAKELGSLKVVCVEACWCVRLLAAAAIERQLKCLSDDSAKGGMRTSSAQHLLRQHGTARLLAVVHQPQHQETRVESTNVTFRT
jgi:hypothetical protein